MSNLPHQKADNQLRGEFDLRTHPPSPKRDLALVRNTKAIRFSLKQF